jgi:nucleotide-binding universal stress UspA family protein
MIRRILIALDPDSDTPVATRYAVDIAKHYDAEVTGLAVIDMGQIEAGSRGGGIGSMYYAEKLRQNLTAEARAKAHELLAEFESLVKEAGVRYGELLQEGVPFQRIVEDMNYYDLLVVGKEPHFFYSHPEQRTETLVRVVKSTVAPTLVVGKEHRPVNRVLITYDGSTPSARAMRRFLHLKPFGTEVNLELLNIYKDDENEAALLLRLAQAYTEAHGFTAKLTSRKGNDVSREIVDHVQTTHADLVVAGAHSVSKIKEWAFGSTTNSLLKECPVPLFLDD